MVETTTSFFSYKNGIILQGENQEIRLIIYVTLSRTQMVAYLWRA